MDVCATHILPRQAIQALHAGGDVHCGLAGAFCWTVQGESLSFWRHSQGRDARVRVLRLPRAVADALNCGLFVAILPQPHNKAVSVVACTGSGSVAAWMDAHYLEAPVTSEIAAGDTSGASLVITSFAAAVPEDAGSEPVFLGAAGCADGSWLLMQGSTQGLLARRLNAPTPSRQSDASRGVLGTIGSVISWGYAEAFDPSAKIVKRVPSGRPVVQVHVAVLDAARMRVSILTDQSIDCWLVTLGLRPSQQLLWSFQNHVAAQHDQRMRPPADTTNAAFALGASYAHVWLKFHDDSGIERDAVQRLFLDEAGQPVHNWTVQVDAFSAASAAASAPTSAPSSTRPQMACDAAGELVLLLGPGRALVEVSGDAIGDEQRAHLLSADLDSLAVSVSDVPTTTVAAAAVAGAAPGGAPPVPGLGSPAGGTWLVLSSTYGVLELAKGHDAAPAVRNRGGPLTAEQAQQVFQLLDATISQGLVSQQQLARPLLALVSGLGRRLSALGALSPTPNMAVLARYSTQLTDLLPKQWTEAAVAASAPGASFLEQLSEKVSRHSMLLSCLAESGVLHSLEPDVQAVLLENAEKLAVVMGLLQLQMEQQPDSLDGTLLASLLGRAGELSGERGDGGARDVLTPLELFYAQPSYSAPALLEALAEAASEAAAHADAGLTRPSDAAASPLRSQAVLLGSALGVAVASCHARREQLQRSHRLSAAAIATALATPGWLEAASARSQLEAMLRACRRVRARLPAGDGGPQLVRSLFGITEVLLTAHAGAVAAARGSAAKAAQLAEYRAARAAHVPPLLADALEDLRSTAGVPSSEEPATRGMAGGASRVGGSDGRLVWQVEELCHSHHCYAELYTVCVQLAQYESPSLPISSSRRLHHYMGSMAAEEAAQERDTFANYVFQRLFDDGLHAELLMLPSTFFPGLAEFLQQHPKLLWLLLLRSGDFGGGASALVQTAGQCAGQFGHHRRLTCLAKLSAHAAGDAPAEVAATSQLSLLQVQMALGLAPGQGAMPLPALVDAALHAAKQPAPANAASARGGAVGAAAALLALEALAACSPEERDANRSRWQLTWLQLLASTDWASLEAEHGADLGPALEATPLYQGVVACCGRGAFGYGASVTDGGPALEVRGYLREWTARGQSGRTEALVTQAFELALAHGCPPSVAVDEMVVY